MVWDVRVFEQQLSGGKLLTVKYEDLLSSPRETMLRIGEFMGVENPAEIAIAYETQANDSEFSNNYDKWRQVMSPDDQRVYEAVAGEALATCGYERNYPDAKLGLVQRLKFEIRIFIRLVRVNIYHALSSLPQDKQKWQASKWTRFFQPGKANPRE
jgi:hypothetical protein